MKTKPLYIYPFNELGKVENVLDYKEFKLHQKVVNGEAVTQEEKDFLFDCIRNDSFFNRAIALRGCKLDFDNFLNCYWVKFESDISEHWAFNKTSIRNYYKQIDNIIKIVLIETGKFNKQIKKGCCGDESAHLDNKDIVKGGLKE